MKMLHVYKFSITGIYTHSVAFWKYLDCVMTPTYLLELLSPTWIQCFSVSCVVFKDFRCFDFSFSQHYYWATMIPRLTIPFLQFLDQMNSWVCLLRPGPWVLVATAELVKILLELSGLSSGPYPVGWDDV